MLRILIISFLVSIPVILAQKPGGCPNIKGVARDPQKRIGIWYVHSKSFNHYDKALECDRMTWNLPNGTDYKVVSESISTITNKVSSVVMEGRIGSGILRTHVPVLGEVDFDIVILSHDYDRWAVMHQCDSQENTHTEKGWILTRERFPDERKLYQFVDQSYRRWGLQKPEFKKVPQNCPMI